MVKAKSSSKKDIQQLEGIPRVIDTIRLLLGKRKPEFSFEKETRLFELQTWAYQQYFSDEDEWYEEERPKTKDAFALSATKFLRHMEELYESAPTIETGSSEHLVSLFEIADYRRLFDEAMTREGGWLTLVGRITYNEFDNIIANNIEQAATVSDLMDYRFRYLDHGGIDKKLSNISHAYVYRFNQKKEGRSVSGKTIRNRWLAFKSTAVFIYVSEKTGFRFRPRSLTDKAFIEGIVAEANDVAALTKYFGRCAYVAEKFSPGDNEPIIDCFPGSSELDRIRLDTKPLPTTSDGHIVGLENYRMDYNAFKDN